uniref:proline--tRNA ligase n=1 Tax=Piliocolobus tephrosceles TaxID=591936 RepID=A0A8C9GHR8_9PRIM
MLDLTTGSLTPLALKFDTNNIIQLYFDEELKTMEQFIIHPLHNCSSIYIKQMDVIKFCEHYKHTPNYITIKNINKNNDNKEIIDEYIKKEDNETGLEVTSSFENIGINKKNLKYTNSGIKKGKNNSNINGNINSDKKLNEQNILGINCKKNEKFSEWYTQVIVKGELIEYYDISGCYIIRPSAYYIWECLQSFFNKEIKKLNVENSYFPLFVTKNKLEKEKNHIEGFSPEVAWVTKYGNTTLPEEIAIRPTSETIMYSAFSKWIRSYRDLPLKLNQWNTVVRWEFKQPTPFIRTREFLWQEGHTAHKYEEEAVTFVFDILELYRRWFEECLAVPIIKGLKSEGEKFGGAQFTSTAEAFISENGRAIQAATSHYLSTNFAKMFKIEYEDENEVKQYVHQTSWGCTTRSIGIMIMTHGDDNGLVLPPNVAKYKVVIIPILYKNSDENAINNYCKEIEKTLKNAEINCIFDNRSLYSPGYKFNHWELRGIPIRIEVGPKDLQNNSCVLVRRDNNEKIHIKKESILLETQQMLVDIHKNLFLKAKKKLDDSIVQVTNFSEVMDALNKKKMILAPWCEDINTEEEIKKETKKLSGEQLTVETALSGAMKPLCIPLDQPPLLPGTKCFWTGKPAKRWCLFGRSY